VGPVTCPECGLPLVWAGMHFSPHTQRYHEATRRRLLGAVAGILDREAKERAWALEAAVQGLVGIRWRSGVYPALGCAYTQVPRELWEMLGEEGRAYFLREFRAGLAWQVKKKYGLDVNPATFFHKMYDGGKQVPGSSGGQAPSP
jgi:hypothetical protein